MEISYGLVNLMYFMLCGELIRIKGSRSNKRRKLLTCFTNSLFKVYNNLSLRETGPEVYNTSETFLLIESLTCISERKVNQKQHEILVIFELNKINPLIFNFPLVTSMRN